MLARLGDRLNISQPSIVGSPLALCRLTLSFVGGLDLCSLTALLSLPFVTVSLSLSLFHFHSENLSR